MRIIQGNAGEIGALSGLTEVKSRGVDSEGPGFRDPASVVKSLARRESASSSAQFLAAAANAPWHH